MVRCRNWHGECWCTFEGLEEGVVTRGDIHRICPHPINPCALKVPGKILREVILKARKPNMENLEVKGFGFRGK